MLRYRTVGLLYTRTCPLACRHCIIESSPKAAGKMDRRSAEDYLEVIARFSGSVCFTGGEPMLYFNEVVELTARASSMGLAVSMVSGAGWVSLAKPWIVRDRMRALHDAGLLDLDISWDRYHEEWSPPENAALLATAADEAGITVNVRGVVPATEPRPLPKTAFGRFPATFQPLIQLGSAKHLPEEQFHHLPLPHAATCEIVLSPVIEPDGTVYACCGPARFGKPGNALILGSTCNEPLEAIFDRATLDPLLHAILLIGPRGLHDLLETMPAYADIFPRRVHYNSMCDLCLDMTDSPAILAALRMRLGEPQMRALLAAAQMRFNHRQLERRPRARPLQTSPTLQETSHAV